MDGKIRYYCFVAFFASRGSETLRKGASRQEQERASLSSNTRPNLQEAGFKT